MSLTITEQNPSVPLPRPSPGPFGPALPDTEHRYWVKYDPRKLKNIQIAFLNGNDIQKDKVKQYASEWLRSAALKFDWVEGIHGDIRVAFDDNTVKGMSWSYIGTDNTKSTPLPETVHLGDVASGPISDYEIIVIEHCFGHALGLKFAPDMPNDAWQNFVDDKVSNTLNLAPGPPNQNWPPSPLQPNALKTDFTGCIDKTLEKESVMAFGWKNKISPHDRGVIASIYPILVTEICFGVQDAFDKSIKEGQDDLFIYAVTKENVLYRNIRKAKVNAWDGWTYIAEMPPQNPDDINGMVVLELSDRVEVFVAIKNDLWFYTDKAWPKWKWNNNDQKNWKRYEKVKIAQGKQVLRAVEVESGFEVFFIAKTDETGGTVLGSILRKPNDSSLPNNWHPVSVGEGIKCINSARIGSPTITNPPRIVAATGKSKVLITLPNKTTLSWTLNDEGLFGTYENVSLMATGMAADTQHVFVIDGEGKLHHNMNQEGWVTWDDINPPANPPADSSPTKFVSIAAGVFASSDNFDGYLSVFAVTNKGKLYYNLIDYEGTWQKKDGWALLFGTTIQQQVKRVFAKRARSGDLEVFAFVEEVETGVRQVLYRFGFEKSTKAADPPILPVPKFQRYVFW